jgi:hypothetical protein
VALREVELKLLLEARASIALEQGLELGPVRANVLRDHHHQFWDRDLELASFLFAF